MCRAIITNSFTLVQFKSCFSYKNDVFKGRHPKNYSWINHDSKRAELHTVLKKPERKTNVFFVLFWGKGGVSMSTLMKKVKKTPKGAVRAAVQRWEMSWGGWAVAWAAASAGAILTSSVSEDSGALSSCTGPNYSHHASGCF